MASKWDGQSEKRNLVTALCIIHDLLNTTELNLDDMEDETRDSIRVAVEFLDEAQTHRYITIEEGRLILSGN
jgi:hypothetical protein